MKQMKRLKRRLLVQIRSRGEPEHVACDREFLRSWEQFLETEKSLRRVQAAMVAWAGALDALSACSQTLAEELARHTILVTRPTNPADHGRNDPTTFCRALQGMMSATESVSRPAHGVFVNGALRPLMENLTNDAAVLHARLDVRKKKLEVYSVLRKRHPRVSSSSQHYQHMANPGSESAHGDAAVDASGPNAPFARKASGSSSASAEVFVAEDEGRSDARSKRERVEAAERALGEATDACVVGLRSFRETQIARLPDTIGVALGCYHGFAARLSALLAPHLSQFPRAACAVVDIAHEASIVKDRALQRRLVQIEAASAEVAMARMNLAPAAFPAASPHATPAGNHSVPPSGKPGSTHDRKSRRSRRFRGNSSSSSSTSSSSSSSHAPAAPALPASSPPTDISLARDHAVNAPAENLFRSTPPPLMLSASQAHIPPSDRSGRLRSLIAAASASFVESPRKPRSRPQHDERTTIEDPRTSVHPNAKVQDGQGHSLAEGEAADAGHDIDGYHEGSEVVVAQERGGGLEQEEDGAEVAVEGEEGEEEEEEEEEEDPLTSASWSAKMASFQEDVDPSTVFVPMRTCPLPTEEEALAKAKIAPAGHTSVGFSTLHEQFRM